MWGSIRTKRSRHKVVDGELVKVVPKAPSRLKQVWYDMKRRCYVKRAKNYKWYGAKGITVCEAWHVWEEFEKWALENGYDSKLTIDRLDGTKGYSPDNCRWATSTQQKETTVVPPHSIMIEGKKYLLSAACEKVGIAYGTVAQFHYRYRPKYTIQEVFDSYVKYGKGKPPKNAKK